MPPAVPYGEDGGEAPDGRRRRRWLLILLATLVAVGAVAAVLLLSPAGKVTVPEVTGQTEQAAGAILRRSGLTPIPSLTPSSTVPSGHVVRQAPGAGARVAKGARVNIVISGGPASIALVNVEGLTAGQAEARLRTAGFKPLTRSQASSTTAAGHVITTDPAAGTIVQVGSPVTVFVSSGPAPVHVPDVTGQSRSAAEATLTAAGLNIGTVTQRSSSTQAPGTVISESPGAGSALAAGGKVNLTLAQAPTEVTVPNVVGKDEASAAAALGGAGLTPKTATTPTSEEAKVGIVVKQSPAGGGHAHKGATVTITVGVLATPPTTTTTPTPTTTTPPAATPPAAPPSEHK
jgi:serine/threonine-protein kinase